MHRRTILGVKVLIIVLIALLLLSQIVLLPIAAAALALAAPQVAYLGTACLIVAIAFVGCVEVVLVCVWRLLSLVRASSIFSRRSFVSVDVILTAVLVATALIAASLIAVVMVAAPFGVLVLCGIGVTVGAGLALVVVVMRGLLRQASQLESDLSEVV